MPNFARLLGAECLPKFAKRSLITALSGASRASSLNVELDFMVRELAGASWSVDKVLACLPHRGVLQEEGNRPVSWVCIKCL